MLTEADKSWRCFHCDEVFTNPEHAAEHFGEEMHDTPACKLSNSEGHLVTLIRKLQHELASYRHEDNIVLRAWFSKEAEHQQALLREEEKGYARGIADMVRDPEAYQAIRTLRESGYSAEEVKAAWSLGILRRLT